MRLTARSDRGSARPPRHMLGRRRLEDMRAAEAGGPPSPDSGQFREHPQNLAKAPRIAPGAVVRWITPAAFGDDRRQLHPIEPCDD